MMGRMGVTREVPVGVAAFVGRERERADLTALVADERIVTLTGAGGCGKSRLASEVSLGLAARFGEGVRWVDLQGVHDAEVVPSAVAGALGAHERPRESLVDTLVRELDQQDQLLVLDNGEHLVGAVAGLVARLARGCRRLHVLTTSRVPLAIDGEVTVEVEPLPVPPPGARAATSVAATAAARLFEVRARQVVASFRIDDVNAAAVAEICRRLDGIPLALELAAARVRALAPSQIAAALSDRFRLLTGGSRDAPARQRTLEASIDWSYELLKHRQRVTLARLSVFAGSFELDAAEAVVSDEYLPADQVLDEVAALVERSLVHVVDRGGRARYRLLETIRMYGRRRLAELDDPDRVRDRHLAVQRSLAARAGVGLDGPDAEAWVGRLTADLDDLRLAMERAAVLGDLEAMVDLTEPVGRFWFDQGLSAEVRRRLHAAIDDAVDAPASQRFRGLLTSSLLAFGAGEAADAHATVVRAVAAAPASAGGALLVGRSVRALTGCMSGHAATDDVLADVAQVAEAAEAGVDPSSRAFALVLGGSTRLRVDTLASSGLLLREAISVCEEAEIPFHLPAAHAALGLWPVLSGDLARSRRHARQGVVLARQVGRPGWESVALTGLAAAAVLEGDHGRARAWLTRAGDVARPPAEAALFDMPLRHWGALAAFAAARFGEAFATASGTLGIARDRGARWDEALARWMLGVATLAQGGDDEACHHLDAARKMATEPRLPFILGRATVGLAERCERLGDLEQAWELALDGLALLADYGDRVGAAAALDVVADLAVQLDRADRGLRLLAASDRFHVEAGLARLSMQRRRCDRTREVARKTLGEAEAGTCTEEGGRRSLEAAVAYARRGRQQRGRPPSGWEALTPAEREVVRLVVEGHTNARIGELLFVSVNTVKTHLSHVYAKLEVRGRADLAAEAVRRAPWITPDEVRGAADG